MGIWALLHDSGKPRLEARVAIFSMYFVENPVGLLGLSWDLLGGNVSFFPRAWRPRLEVRVGCVNGVSLKKHKQIFISSYPHLSTEILV